MAFVMNHAPSAGSLAQWVRNNELSVGNDMIVLTRSVDSCYYDIVGTGRNEMIGVLSHNSAL